MLSLDPDDFLADVAEDREDSPSLPFPATEKVAEEEELEWLSNKDAFPAVETCMLSEEPPNPIANARRQNHRVSVSVVKAGIGKTLLPPMPSRRSKKGSAKVKHKTVCTYCGFAQTPPWPEEPLAQHILCKACGYSYKPGPLCPEDSAKVEGIKRQCTHCGITKTPQWRHGPLGRKTLCNACGVRYKSGRLCPEYRPANSPTFSSKLHSNAHRKVMQIRKEKYGTVSKPADKCVATSALTKSKKNLFPAVTTVNILEQPSRSVIAEEQSPVSVLENSSNSSTTFMSFSGPLKLPQQPPSKFLRQQLLFCDRPNNHNQEDTTKVEIERNSTILKSSFGTLKPPYKAPSEVLGQQQLVSYQPNNKRKKKDTAEVEIEGNSTTFMSSCGTLEPPHQAPSKFLDQQQLFYNQPNKKRNNKNTAKVETAVKPVDKCTTTLMKSNKDSFPAVEILNILEQSSGIVIAKQQSPVLVLENSTNRSATLINSCGTIEPPHQTSRKFMGQQQLFCNQANNKPNKKDSANVEIEGNSPAAMRSCGMLESPHQAPSEFLGQQQLFCNQPNNKSNKKETGKVGIEGKCQNCGAEQSPRWWEGPLGPKTLCLSCGLAKYTARRQRSVSLASNKKCNKKDTAKVEMAVKPVESVDKCTNSTTTLMKLNKDPFPAVKTLNISEKPSVIVIAEQQSPVFVLENSRNSSMTLMSSSGTVDPPHQAPSEFLGQQQQQFCDQANNKPKENDTATVEIEGNSTTLMSSSGTLEPPHQAPNNFLEQQQLFWKQANNKPNKKDTARVESEANSTTLMSSCRTPKPPHQAQSGFLGQQQQFCNQAYNETNKENTAKVESEGNSTTLMSSCRTPELTHQARSKFLVQQQLVCNQADNETNKENTAEVEIKGKCENCGAEHSPRWLGGPLGPKTLCFACGLAKCTAKRQRCIAVEVGKLLRPLPATGEFSNSTRTFPALEEFFLSQKPSNIAIAENQKPFSVPENSTNNSTTLINSCRIKIPHRTRTKGLRRRRSTIPGQQVGIKRMCLHCGKQTQRWRMGRLGPTTLCSACGNRYEPLWGRSGVTEDIAKKCQHCGSEETTQWLSCPLGPKTLCNACYHWFKYGRRQFCNQTNNNPDKKASAEVEIRRKCQHCGAEETPLWRAGPLGCKTLCNACGIRWYKFGDLCREYCPASSPTFSRELHSNFYRKVTGMRKQDIGVEMVVEPVDKKNTIGE